MNSILLQCNIPVFCHLTNALADQTQPPMASVPPAGHCVPEEYDKIVDLASKFSRSKCDWVSMEHALKQLQSMEAPLLIRLGTYLSKHGLWGVYSTCGVYYQVVGVVSFDSCPIELGVQVNSLNSTASSCHFGVICVVWQAALSCHEGLLLP